MHWCVIVDYQQIHGFTIDYSKFIINRNRKSALKTSIGLNGLWFSLPESSRDFLHWYRHRLRAVSLLLSPSCVTRKKSARKKAAWSPGGEACACLLSHASKPAWQAVESKESQNERGREKRGRIFSRFTRSSFLFPSPSDACHAGYMLLSRPQEFATGLLHKRRGWSFVRNIEKCTREYWRVLIS